MARIYPMETNKHVRLDALSPRRRLSAALGALRRIYRLTHDCAFLPRELEWLEDNRYIITRIENQLTGALAAPVWTGRRYEKLFSLCRRALSEAFDRGADITEGYLTSCFADAHLSLRECGAAPDALKLSFLCFLAGFCEEFERSALRAKEGRRRENPELSRAAGFVITAFRCLESIDLDGFCANISPIEQIYAADPAGAYTEMDEPTRAVYRSRTAVLSRRARIGEAECARRVLGLARAGTDEKRRHVGFYLFEEPLGAPPRRAVPALYLALILGIAAALSALALTLGFGAWTIAAFLLLAEIVKGLIDPVFLRALTPAPAFSMEPCAPLSDDERTICVIAALAASAAQARALCARLESFYLAAKGGKNLTFGLLLDLPEADTAVADGDGEILSAARAAIDALNLKYNDFCLFTRPRRFSQTEGRYIAPERKRGALEELASLLGGLDSALTVHGAPVGEDVRYIVTLDADTEPAVDAISRAAAIMRHPLNRPEVENGRVVRGHGILQPRLSYALGGVSDFARILTGSGGSDIYGAAASDLYEGLLGETNFTGKGVIDVAAYLAVLRGKLPKERILSHDLLEGAFMRAGYAAQPEFFENFPPTAKSFFTREHRWIRGDWQLIGYLMPRVKNADGKGRDPLPFHAKLRILDNLLRSLQPVLTVLFVFLPLCGVLPIYALALVFSQIFAPIAMCSDAPRERYHSYIMNALARTISLCALKFMFLPKSAWTALDAAARTLWRLTVSRRHLLEWRTSTQTELAKNGTLSTLAAFAPCLIAGVALLFVPYSEFFTALLRILIALVWISAPFAALRLNRVRKEKKKPLSCQARQWILGQCERMYGYFRDNVGEDTCDLPPDNVQLRPARGKAPRTSPTNIGLALISYMTAADLGIEDEDTALSRIDAMLTTVERLEKWHGNLYNWYSTADCSVLYPRSVSAVDSGNLAACLIALEAALDEKEGGKAAALALRVHALSENMQLSPLYDPARQLFRLGYDAQHDKFDSSHYDLLASEARLTSYIAVARGEADARHWRRLGRPIGALGRRRGLLSWSGTMFEYLMPAIFLPAFPGSLLYESRYYALYCQKNRMGGYPYGISESCFFAFDEQMNYQYKAHGVQAAGLKRALDRETVIAPYAAWLTMTVDPQEAYRNLRSFEKLDASGPWGFFEALDLTRGRIPNSAKYMPVRCFMAHHVGMSLAAAANALADGIWQRRFMASPVMAAHTSLLKEQMPVGAPIETAPAAPRTEKRPVAQTMELTGGDAADIRSPFGIMLTGGAMRIFATQLGIERVICAGSELVEFAPESMGERGGVRFFVSIEDKLYSLTPAPELSPYVSCRSQFTPSYVQYFAETDEFSAVLRVSLSASEKAARFSLKLENKTKAPLEGRFVAAFQPVLDTFAAYSGHPAFSKLFLSSRFDSAHDGLAFTRRTRTGAESMYAALVSSCPALYESSRERALGRAGYARLSVAPHENAADTGAPEPYAAAFSPFAAKPGESAGCVFALGSGGSEDDSFAAAKSVLSCADGMESHRMYEIIEALGMDQAQVSAAFALYTRARLYSPCGREKKTALASLGTDRRFLWRWGISGDYPLILVDDPGEEAAERYLQAHMFLFLCGAYCDLALITPQGGYLRGGFLPVLDIMRQWGGETLLSQRAGVHLIDGLSLTSKERGALIALCDLLPEDAPETEEALRPIPKTGLADAGRAENPCRIADGNAEFAGLSGLTWSHPLANEDFGYLACDSGAGMMWYKNSRENRINEWRNDPLAVHGPEDIELVTGNVRRSLFARGADTAVSFTPGFAKWQTRIDGIECTLTAFVHPHINARVFTVELRGGGAEKARIVWHTGLVLGETPDARRTVVTDFDGSRGAITAQNRANTRFSPYKFIACAYPRAVSYTCDAYSFRSHVMDGRSGPGLEPCAAFELTLMKDEGSYRAVIAAGCGETDAELDAVAALSMPSAAHKARQETELYWAALCSDLTIETPDKRIDSLVNSFLPYQVIAGRIFARSSVYQSSGAYGFRDQLQDAANLLYMPPSDERWGIAREQILRGGAHQYREGDVQHWWHPDGDEASASRGVRTRISDDLLFLPYTALIYAEKTGKTDIFDEELPFLESQPLAEGENERLESAPVSRDTAPLWDHCAAALECVMRRGRGAHGLAYIGGGDWNDAMNEVGLKGRGESVWLSFFAALVFYRMASAAGERCGADRVLMWRRFAQELTEAAFEAWDGDHFLRGYHDDGDPIGASASDACRIDAIAQAFAAFAPQSDVPQSILDARNGKTALALSSARGRLFDGRVVRLFDPPFTTRSRQNPGYIKGYTPGVRENGGQYTHGAIWLAMGLIRKGFTDDGARMLGALTPSGRQGYRGEPFYIAADVYTCPELYGRSGWTVYTGAAGWYLRAVTDELLGLHFFPGKLVISPRLPSMWNGFRVKYTAPGVRLTVNVRRGSARSVMLDGAPVEYIPWPPAPGAHEADVVVK